MEEHLHCEANHHSHHGHNHSHSHSKGLLLVLILTALYMIAEFVGGFLTNSLALTADAGHMLGDVGALALSYFALWLSKRPANPNKTFGYFRAEVFAALLNGVSLILIAGIIIFEAYQRLVSPPEINSIGMIIIAFGGLLVNIIGVLILHRGSKENLNIKGAFLHIVGDLLGSLGAILAGFLIWRFQIYVADPIISFVIAGLVLYSSINLTNSAVQVLMEASPGHLDADEIKSAIKEVENVVDVHDLHIWSIGSKQVSFSVHIVAKSEYSYQILSEVSCILGEKFNIHHATIQIEPEDFHEYDCPLGKSH